MYCKFNRLFYKTRVAIAQSPPDTRIHTQHMNDLISREQTFALDRKILTVHSEDRDVNKWPNSNTFEITLPQTYTNVQSLQLVECNMPVTNYTFCNEYQNTKMSFKVISSPRTNPLVDYYLNINIDQFLTITIQDGFYTPQQLATEIQNKMNRAVTDYLLQPGPDFNSGISYTDALYTHFKVKYDEVGQRIWFGNDYDSFILCFDRRELYDLGVCEQPNVWEHYTKWGLPYHLGFSEKKSYAATPTVEDITFDYNAEPTWITPDVNVPVGVTPTAFFVVATNGVSVYGDTAIYMEIDKFNSVDELMPYSKSTNHLYNNDYNGMVNSFFAKIPLTVNPSNTSNAFHMFDSKGLTLVNFTHFFPPLDKLSKLKFKFRYHDGRLVNFRNENFNFTIAVTSLRDEISRGVKLRTPAYYP